MDKVNNLIQPKSKLWHHIDRLAAIKAGEQPAPVNVEMDLSNRCQMGCSFCAFAYTHSKGPLAKRSTHDTGDLMNTELALHIIDQLAEAGVRSITWSGGGEPTLHPDIVDIIYHADELGIDQGIYTNGLKLKDDYVLTRTLKHVMKWVYLSHGPHGLDDLLAAKGDAVIGVGMMVDSRNIIEIYSQASKASKADYFHLRPIVGGLLRDSDINTIDIIVEALKPYEEINVIYDHDRFEMYHNWKSHGYKTCYWTQVQSVITPDGRVWACCNRRGFEDSCLGDLKEQTWNEVWANSKAWDVDKNCRMMCRGHIPNLTLTKVMEPSNKHKNFI